MNITKAQDHVGVTKNSIFDVPGVGNKHFSGFKNDFKVFFFVIMVALGSF